MKPSKRGSGVQRPSAQTSRTKVGNLFAGFARRKKKKDLLDAIHIHMEEKEQEQTHVQTKTKKNESTLMPGLPVSI